MSYENLIADLRRLHHHIENGGQLRPTIDSRRISRAIEALEQCDRVLAQAKEDSFNDGWESGRARDGGEPTVDEVAERDQDRKDWESGAPVRLPTNL